MKEERRITGLPTLELLLSYVDQVNIVIYLQFALVVTNVLQMQLTQFLLERGLKLLMSFCPN